MWLGDEIVTDFATKERANAKAKNLNDLQNVKDVDKAQVKEQKDFLPTIKKNDIYTYKVSIAVEVDDAFRGSDRTLEDAKDYLEDFKTAALNKLNVRAIIQDIEGEGPLEAEFSFDRSGTAGMTAIGMIRQALAFVEEKMGADVTVLHRGFGPSPEPETEPTDDEYDQMAQQSSMDDRRQQGMNPGLEETARNLGYLEETEKISLALLYTDSGRFYKATFNGQNIGIDDVNRLLKSKDVNMAVPSSYDDEKLDQIGNALGSHGISMSHIDNKDVSEGNKGEEDDMHDDPGDIRIDHDYYAESKLKEMASALGYMNEGDELSRLLQVSSQANVKMGEEKLYKLAMAWEAWNVDNDDKHDDLVDHLFMAVELIQDAGSVKNKEYYLYLRSAKKHLKQFNIDVTSVSGNDLNEEKLEEITVRGGQEASNNYPAKENPGDKFDISQLDELLPSSMDSRRDMEFKGDLRNHAEWARDHQHNLTFVHFQYHEVNDGNNQFRIHQAQHYNGNYNDYRNPRFTEVTVKNLSDGEKSLGSYVVRTDAIVRDLEDLRNKGMITDKQQ